MSVQTPPNNASTGDEVSIGDLAKNASTHLSTIIRGEVELAKAELRVSVKNAGTGALFFVIAAVVVLVALPFVFVSIAELIHWYGVWRWLSYVIVVVFFLLVAAVVGFIGYRKVKKVKAPERTIATTKETAAFLKHPTQA